MEAPSEAKTLDDSTDENSFSDDFSLRVLQEANVERKKPYERLVDGMLDLRVDNTNLVASDAKFVEEVASEPDVKRTRVGRVDNSTAAAPDVPYSEWHDTKSAERLGKVIGFQGIFDTDLNRKKGRPKELQAAVATKFPSPRDVTQAKLRRLKGTKEPRKAKRPPNDFTVIKTTIDKIIEQVTPDFRADQSTSALYVRFLVLESKTSSMWTVPIPNIEVAESDRNKMMTMCFPNCFSMLENIKVFFADLDKDMQTFHAEIFKLGQIIHGLPEGCVTMQMWVGANWVERA
jgi:hypothetical protein